LFVEEEAAVERYREIERAREREKEDLRWAWKIVGQIKKDFRLCLLSYLSICSFTGKRREKQKEDESVFNLSSF